MGEVKGVDAMNLTRYDLDKIDAPLCDEFEDTPEPVDFCERCETDKPGVNADDEGAYRFTAPLCRECKDAVIKDGEMDDFDRAYERARCRGWED
jgi:hypothetical protein